MLIEINIVDGNRKLDSMKVKFVLNASIMVKLPVFLPSSTGWRAARTRRHAHETFVLCLSEFL